MKTIIMNALKLFFYVLTAVFCFIFVSCQKEKLVDNSSATTSNTIDVKVVANYESGTKTEIGEDGKTVLWNEGDNLTIIEVAKKTSGSSLQCVKGEPVDNSTAFDGKQFKATFSQINTTGLQKICYYAVYPEKALTRPSNVEGLNKVAIDLESVQEPTATSFGPGSDILIAMPSVSDGQASGGLAFDFRRVVSVGKMRIHTLDSDEDIIKVTFTAHTGNISGKAYFNFNESTIGLPSSYGNSKEVTLEYYDAPLRKDTNGDYYVYFTAWPGSVSNGFTVTAETEHYIYTKDIALIGNKTLDFTAGNYKNFAVNFAGADKDPRGYYSVLPDAEQFIISSGSKAMFAGNNLNYLNSTSNEIEDNVVKEENLPAVWAIEFDNFKNKYKISSVYPKKYVNATKDKPTLKLVDNAEDATEFVITKKDDGSYLISFEGRAIEYESSNELFRMSLINKVEAGLAIEGCSYSPIVKVSQENLTVPAEGVSNTLLSLTYFGVTAEDLTADANAGWITASIDGSNLKLSVADNGRAKREGTVYIKKAEDVLATIKVTQQANSENVKYALLDINDINNDYSNKWGTLEQSYDYVQDNGAKWTIKCLGSKQYLNLTKDCRITLPTFVNNIKKIKVTTYGYPQQGRTLNIYSGAKPVGSKTLNSNEKEYEILLTGDVKTCYMTSVSPIAIAKIEVDAREYLETPEITEPENGKFELKWTSVNNAEVYDVMVGTETATVETNSYEFKGDAEWYDVTVVAKANPESPDYIDSKPATTRCKFGSPTLDTPEITVTSVGHDNISVEWTEDSRAASYSCEITPDGTGTINGNNCTFIKLTENVTYKITVTAKSDDYNTASKTISVTTATKKLNGNGSQDFPYTLEDLNTLETEFDLTGKYITGTVKSVDTVVDGKMTYTIEDNNGYIRTIEGYDLGNAPFTSSEQLSTGVAVIVYYISNTDNCLYKIGEHTEIFTGIETDIKEAYDYGKGVDFKVYAVYRGKTKEDVTSSCTIKIDGQIVSLPVILGAGEHSVSIAYNSGEPIDKTFSVTEKQIEYVHEYKPENMQGTGGNAGSWYNIDEITTRLTNFNNSQRTTDYIRGGNNNAPSTGIIETTIPEKIKTITVSVGRCYAGVSATLNVRKGDTTLIKDKHFDIPVQSAITPYREIVITLAENERENDCTYELVFECNQKSIIQINKLIFKNY